MITLKKIENINYAGTDCEQQTLDIYLPDTDIFPVYIFFHGGGLESGSKSDYSFFENLQKQGIATVSANYRLYPNVKYPEFLEDSAMAVSWTFDNISKFGNASAYFIGGISAGGYISYMLCFDKKYLGKYGINPDKTAGYIFDAGQPTTHYNVLRERGIDTRRIIVDSSAPLYHITQERNYPPMLIFSAEHDMPNRYEQTLLLMSAMKTFGYDTQKIKFKYIKNSTHCQYVDKTNIIDGKSYADILCEFIKENM